MFLKYFSVNWSPGFRIPSPWIPDSRSRIPDSKASDSGFHRQKNAGFRIPDSFTWGEKIVIVFFFCRYKKKVVADNVPNSGSLLTL